MSDAKDVLATPEHLARPSHKDVPQSFPPIRSAIPALAAQPFCLYLIGSDDHNVWRYSLDGSKKELAINTNVQGGVGGSPELRFAGYRVIRGEIGQDLTVYGFPKNRSTLLDKHIDATRPYEILKDEGDDRPFAPWVRATTSKWKASYHASLDLAGPSTSYMRDELLLTDNSGRIRKHRIRKANPQGRGLMSTLSPQGVLGVYASRYALLFDAFEILVWDLDHDKKWLLAKANDVRIWPRDMNKPERFKPVAMR